jgi:hypothetical protein
MITNQNATLKKGDMKRFTIPIEKLDGTEVDLRNFTVYWYLYRENGYAPIVTKASTDTNQIKITDPLTGEVTVILRSQDTKTLTDGRYYHELQIVDNEGEPSTVTTGYLTILSKT